MWDGYLSIGLVLLFFLNLLIFLRFNHMWIKMERELFAACKFACKLYVIMAKFKL
jgi:hypothetical protein